MSNIAMHLDLTLGGAVNAGEDVVFNQVRYVSDGISYNPANGVITINQSGRFVFNWWVATQSAASPAGVVLALVTSEFDVLTGNSPAKTGQTNGVGVVEVGAPPVTVTLRNTGGGTMYFSSQMPVKASLVVYGDTPSLTPVSAFGALSTNASELDLIELPTIVPLTVPSPSAQNVLFMPANHITILETGTYRVDVKVTGRLSTNADVRVVLVRSMSPVFPMTSTVSFSSGVTTTISMFNYLDVTAGDDLAVYMSATAIVTFDFPPEGYGVTLAVQRVS